MGNPNVHLSDCQHFNREQERISVIQYTSYFKIVIVFK